MMDRWPPSLLLLLFWPSLAIFDAEHGFRSSFPKLLIVSFSTQRNRRFFLFNNKKTGAARELTSFLVS
jgi:hypothetical protein